jgi:hypothetical protein
MTKIAKFLRLKPADRWLLVEATLLLLLARAALKLLPFRAVVRFVSPCAPTASPGGAGDDTLVRRVRWAIRLGSRNGPGEAVCFPQALAAHRMLSRRGTPSRLYYGIGKSSAGALEAHVWVRAGSLAVVGCALAPRFTLLTSFPQDSASSAPAAGTVP